jgi:hypothetical protein
MEVYDQVDSGLGTWKMTNPLNSATMNSAGTAALRKILFSTGVAAVAQQARFARTAGQVYLQGFIPYDSAVPAIDFIPMGWPGSGYADWTDTTNSWGPYYGQDVINADLIINQMGIDAYAVGASPSVIYSGLMTLGARDKVMGRDLLLVTPSPPNIAAYGGRSWVPYIQAHYDAARDLDVPLIDTTSIFGAWSTTNVFDDVHYRASANQRIAAAVDIVLAMAAS